MSRVLPWLGLAALVTIASVGFEVAGLPSPVLFGALLGALGYALTPAPDLTLTASTFKVGQAIIGVTVGASVDVESLGSFGSELPVIVAVSAGTLVVSVAAGQLLRLHGVSAVTASFSSIAGGASGMTALAHDLGADDRVVTVIQYLRVLVILLFMPVAVSVVFHVDASSSSPSDGTVGASDLGFVVVAIVLGVVGGRLLRLPSPALLGPLVAALLLTLLPPFQDVTVPWWVQGLGFLVIGTQVGLRFTRDSVRAIGKMLPTALGVVALIIAACAGLGVLLAAATGESELDSYLATTPGGLYAVLATSTATEGNVTFVTAVQMLRLLMVLFLAPVLARVLRPRSQ